MCRIFGFRSVLQSAVHRSLLDAENALAVQSQRHPDGWGVAYYLARAPHLLRSPTTAIGDGIFTRVSGVVASETVLAHIRRATTGEINVLNCHPFQYGRWVFAHNGQVRHFSEHRGWLVERVHPHLRRYILGTTDSEVLFLLVLTELSRRADLHREGTPVQNVFDAVRATLETVLARCDRGASRPEGGASAQEGCGGEEEPSSLTVAITDGHTMLATRWGKPLHLSTRKWRCADRESCPFLARECEGPPARGHVNHLIVSSEQLQGENVWEELGEGDTVAVDWRMTLHRARAGGELAAVTEA